MNVDSLPELMRAPEVMAFLRISRTTLNRWIETGKLPALKLGGRQRFDRDDVLRLLERR